MFFDTATTVYMDMDEAPKMKTVEYKVEEGEHVVPIRVASKKDVIVKPEDRNKLYQHFSVENIYEFNTGRCVVDDISHSYNNAEYSAEGNRFYFSLRQVNYMRSHPDADVKIAVYGLERNKDAAPDFIKEAFIPDVSKARWFNFMIPFNVKVDLFEEPEIHRIDKTMELLYINLPYEFYKDIFLPAKIFYYDMDTDETKLFFYTIQENNQLDLTNLGGGNGCGEDISHVMNAHLQPIRMKMEDSCIVSVDNFASLVYAIYMRVPYISAVIAIGDHSCEYEKMTPRRLNKEAFNKAFYPFFQA